MIFQVTHAIIPPDLNLLNNQIIGWSWLQKRTVELDWVQVTGASLPSERFDFEFKDFSPLKLITNPIKFQAVEAIGVTTSAILIGIYNCNLEHPEDTSARFSKASIEFAKKSVSKLTNNGEVSSCETLKRAFDLIFYGNYQAPDAIKHAIYYAIVDAANIEPDAVKKLFSLNELEYIHLEWGAHLKSRDVEDVLLGGYSAISQ